MLNLVAAEWLKLTRRPFVWALLAVFLGLLAAQFVTQAVLITMLDEPSPTVARQLEEWRRRTVFPGLFGAVFNHVNGLGGVFAVVLAAAAMGSEYSWGTLRTQLARRPHRGQFILAKLIVLLALLVCAVLLALILATLLGLIFAALGERGGGISAGDLAQLPVATVRAVFVLLPYVLLTLCITVLRRSLLAGLVGGLLYLVFEVGLGALTLFEVLGGVWREVYNLTIGQNINALALQNSHAFGLYPEQLTGLDITALPSPLQATLVVTLYCALFLALTLRSIDTNDVFGPT